MENFITAELHYDLLIMSENDPVNDPLPLKEYMNKWDGEDFLDMVKPTKGKTILEIGVGTGRLALKVLPLGYKKFCGIDISEKTIERARHHMKHYPEVELLMGDFLTAEFKEKYDIIYSTLTFFHIEKKEEAIAKIFILLKDSGKFVLSIEKETEETYDYVDYNVKMFPDTVDSTVKLLKACHFKIMNIKEVEKANIICAEKLKD